MVPRRGLCASKKSTPFVPAQKSGSQILGKYFRLFFNDLTPGSACDADVVVLY